MCRDEYEKEHRNASCTEKLERINLLLYYPQIDNYIINTRFTYVNRKNYKTDRICKKARFFAHDLL